MNAKILALLGFVAVVAGCAAPQIARPRIVLNTQFDGADAERMLVPGSNTVSGSALLRQAGGGVVTCAGTPVELVPATKYAVERADKVFGSVGGGYFSAAKVPPVIDNDSVDYKKLRRKVTCDAQGKFEFTEVSEGDFYVAAYVTWRVNAYSQEGGLLLKRVTVKDGKKVNVILTQP